MLCELAQNKPAVSLTVEGGVGLEYKGGIKGAKDLEAKAGGALKGEVEVSSEGVKVSAKGELGGAYRAREIGRSRSRTGYTKRTRRIRKTDRNSKQTWR